MKKGFFRSLVGLLFVFLINNSFAATLQNIQFYQAGEFSYLEFSFDDNNVQAKRKPIKEDKQIIVDIENVTATKRVLRAFTTSEFPGSVIYVSSYERPGKKGDIRVAVQLRDNTRSVLRRKPNKIVLKVENRFGVFTQADLDKELSIDEKLLANDQESLGKLNIPKTSSIEDILENLTMSGKKKYIGNKISFNVKNVQVADLLSMIAEVSGFNIIITDDIKKLKPLTLSLTNIAWDQALDTIMNLNKLVAKKNGIILIVQTLEQATKDLEMEIAAKKKAQKEEPLVTKIFPISFANLKDMQSIISGYLTKERGTIAPDVRTSSLIIKDTADVIEKVKKIVEYLDTQTAQVLIETKIVEVNESYSKQIGLKNGLGFGYDPVGEQATDLAVVGEGGGTSQGGPGFTFSSAPTATASLVGFSLNRFNRLFNVGFNLQLMESESKGKVIATPKIITENNKKATISSIDETHYAKTEIVDGAVIRGFEGLKAELKLDVTPHVTNDGSISLDISLSKEDLGQAPANIEGAPPDKQAREIKTNVLVDNGSTIVIGGVYRYKKEESHSGVPFLKDIPLIGWLFRSYYQPSTIKNELIIFLTPRIINQEEAGLVDQG